MKYRLIFIGFVICLLSPSSYSLAEIKTYTYTVKQPIFGSQSPDDARIAAIAKAKREVLEMSGTYLETMTIVKDHEVEKDKILALAAAVLKTEIVSQKNYADEDGFGIILQAKVDVDTSILDERVEKLLQDRPLLDKYNRAQEHEKELLARIKELENENQNLKNLSPEKQAQKKEALKGQFKAASLGLTASELNQKALALWKEGKFSEPDRALDFLNTAIHLDSNFDIAYINRGNAWRDKGDYDRAISDFNKAIELNPRFDLAYNNRGTARYDNGNYDQAISDFNKAIELNPKLALPYYNRGLVWVSKTNYDRAISDFNKAIELNPRYADAYCNRGQAWNEKGYYDRALSDINKAIELNPNSAEAYNNRGIAWNEKGYYDRALSDINKAIELNPRFAKLYHNRGNAWREKKNYDRAISDYTKAIELNPRLALTYNNRGLAWESKGNYDQAISDYTKTIELNPKYAEAYNNRGAAWKSKGNFDQAISFIFQLPKVLLKLFSAILIRS